MKRKSLTYKTGESVEVGDDAMYSSGAIVTITKIKENTIYFRWNMDDTRGQQIASKFIERVQLLGKNA